MSTPTHLGERLHATILYADISGFTALSERMDPEDVTTVMNRVFETLEAVVMAHGGTVNKYIGDCVMAVFGLSPADVSPAREAVLAALEMRDAIRDFDADGALPASSLGIHIGINTGDVVTGEIGGAVRREFAVMGDAVALAARLEDLSKTGEIVVGPLTHAATADAFDYEPRETTPVAIWVLRAPKPRGRRTKRGSERRQATVVFADIVGFDALAEHLPPHELTHLLNRCFALYESIVRGYGGVVDKYIGSCLMALFGVPNAIENAPRQAINAAIEMRNRLEHLVRDEGLPAPLGVHMGVNTGLVIAGDIGGRMKRDFTVMGDTVNLASRLKDAAATGVIAVGPETHRWTQETFEYDPPRMARLHGKADLIPVRELASVRQHVHRQSTAVAGRSISSPLVGRDAELGQIHDELARVLSGEGGVVSVVGEAGLGKSRLMIEALSYEPLRGATVLEGRSTAIGQTSSFHPFVDLLRRWAGILDDEDDAEALAKLDVALADVVPAGDDDPAPFIATLMGMRLDGARADRLEGIDGEALENLIVKHVRDVFNHLAASRPLVLVFEDLHWADASSIGLLETLLGLAVAGPVLFINVFRPDYAETAERILRAAADASALRHTVVRIEPLDAEQAGALVRNLLKIDDLPHATRTLITQKAEGNPFYLEEVVRSLIDQGAVEYADGRFRVTARIETVTIPGTVQEVVMARVDRLDEPTRYLLQVASVIGRSFYYRIIAATMHRRGDTDAAVDAELATLQEKQLLLQRGGAGVDVAVGERTVGQELEFVFKHAIAQDTVYDSLLQKTRREIHQLVGDSIETTFADRLSDFYGMLAFHYSRAENLEKAEEFLFKAGDEAARAAASSEALHFFREASQLYFRIHGDGGDPQKKALLEKNIGYALLNTGRLTDSIVHFDHALEYIGSRLPRSSVERYSRFARDITAVLYSLYVPRRGRARPPVSDRERDVFEIMFRRFRALTTSDPQRMFIDNIGAIRRMNRRDPRTIGTACLTYVMGGAAFAYSGTSFAISRRFLQRAEDLIRPGEVGDELGCGFLRFVINFLEGRWRQEPGIAPSILDGGLKHGILWDVNTYRGLESDRQLRQGRFAVAREHLTALADMSEQYGYEFAEANHDGMNALLLLEERQLDDALVAVDRYYAGRDEPSLRVLALGTRAKAQALLGRHDDAGATLEKASGVVEGAGLVPPWHLSAYTTARLRHELVRLEGTTNGRSLHAQAKDAARHARRIAKVVAGARVETWRLVGRLQLLLGRPQHAFATWMQALREAERLDAAPEVARTCAEIAIRARDGSFRFVDADAYLARAHELFDALGLTWDREQTDAGAASRL